MTEQPKPDVIIPDGVVNEIAKRVRLANDYLEQQLPDDFDRPAFRDPSVQKAIKYEIAQSLMASIPEKKEGASPTAAAWISQMDGVRERLKQPLHGVSEIDWRLVVNYYEQQVSSYWNYACNHLQVAPTPLPNNVVSLFGPREGIVSPSGPEKTT